MDTFYARTLTRLLNKGLLARESKILVVCGATVDRDVFHQLGFLNVTISNLDVRLKGNEFKPYFWSFQDAEVLKFGDGEFDVVVEHQGLHHCCSPHRGLLEMFRVAQRMVVVFEPRDSFLVRLGVRLSFGQEYEVAAVAGNGMRFGGVRNSPIPNYVYRWTEREVKKVISTFYPSGRSRLHFFYSLRVPEERLKAMKNRLVAGCVRGLLPMLRLFTVLFPRQTNCFAFAVEKPELPRDLHPWLVMEDGLPAISETWVRQHYGEFK